MNILNASANEIKKCIEESIVDDGFIDKHLYFPCINTIKHVKLKVIDDKTIYGPITMFLINWGIMGRVLNRKDKKGWEKRLQNKISELSELLEKFRRMNFENKDFEKFESEIKKCYGEISEIVGPTSASKTLHIICPSFFPMWDESIRERTGVTASRKGYFLFMKKNSEFIDQRPILFDLSEKYNKTVLKIVDEFFWNSTRD